MKTIIPSILFFITHFSPLHAQSAPDITPADAITRSLAPSTRGSKNIERTQIFSRAHYQELNPGIDPGTRCIRIVAAGSQVQATVNVDAAAQVSFDNIRFKIDSVELADQTSVLQLNAIVQALKQLGTDSSFIIEGHTCDLGADAHNQQLSENRALAVGKFFRRNGVQCELVTLGYGEQEPANSNDSEAQRSKNRRVVIRKKA